MCLKVSRKNTSARFLPFSAILILFVTSVAQGTLNIFCLPADRNQTVVGGLANNEILDNRNLNKNRRVLFLGKYLAINGAVRRTIG